MTRTINGSTCNNKRESMQWVVFPQAEGVDDYPEWIRTAGLRSDGLIYVTAALAASEELVAMFAFEDKVKTVTRGEHLYVPAGWLSQEFPNALEVCQLITRHVRKHFYTHKANNDQTI